mmetsp:Transcript_38125/g.55940  ORF Transcript_38125/g.55940 Transcript_38125/m.55940 type:complete len:80 (-) Transcript_38125:706-945(-)
MFFNKQHHIFAGMALVVTPYKLLLLVFFYRFASIIISGTLKGNNSHHHRKGFKHHAINMWLGSGVVGQIFFLFCCHDGC